MSDLERLSLRDAAKYAGVTHTTIKRWCSEFEIGETIGGRVYIDRGKLQRIIRARLVLQRGRAAAQ